MDLESNPQFCDKEDFVYAIEGNIGCGKSTFLQALRKHIPEAYWIEEPVADWQNLGGKGINILQNYYSQPKRWGFTFQTFAIITRIRNLHEAIARHPKKIKIAQRSILADKFVFSQLMKDLSFMNTTQVQVFKEIYKKIENLSLLSKTKLIYLRCTPETCLERTKIRRRSEENEIPLEYLQRIHSKHEQWFKDHDESKVLIIDTTESFKDDEAKITEMIRQVREFFKK